MGAREFLIVEDDPPEARTLARVFGQYRPVVVVGRAADAFGALEEADRWAGAVLDVRLPDFSGLEVLRFLRARRPRLPALVLTGRFDRDVANRAQSLRAECVFKPASLENLEAFIRRALADDADPHDRIGRVIGELKRTLELTARQIEILGLAVADVPRGAMARELRISENTLKTEVKLLLRRCSQDSLEGLVRLVLRQALDRRW